MVSTSSSSSSSSDSPWGGSSLRLTFSPSILLRLSIIASTSRGPLTAFLLFLGVLVDCPDSSGLGFSRPAPLSLDSSLTFDSSSLLVVVVVVVSVSCLLSSSLGGSSFTGLSFFSSSSFFFTCSSPPFSSFFSSRISCRTLSIYSFISRVYRSLSLIAISSYGFFSSGVNARQRSPMITPCSVNLIPGNSFVMSLRCAFVKKM